MPLLPALKKISISCFIWQRKEIKNMLFRYTRYRKSKCHDLCSPLTKGSLTWAFYSYNETSTERVDIFLPNLFFLSFLGHTGGLWKFPSLGSNQNCSWIPQLQPQPHRSKPCLWPTPELTATQILSPLSKSGDQTRTLTNTSQIRFHWATMGTSFLPNLFIPIQLLFLDAYEE